jgi:hypothetical protein
MAEPVWGAQFVPPVMNAGLIGPLRVFYGLSFGAVGSAGDNNHLYGRHRSYNWDALSRYCTNRSYGTTDARDQGGNRNWYRAVDVGIVGQQLFDASRRMDTLARSGRCPGLAEWAGTFNGVTVVGWFQGTPSSFDSSHLYHLHVGVWNQYANDTTTMQQIYGAVTGTGASPQKGKDMYVIRAHQTGGTYNTNGTTYYHLTSGDLVNAALRIAGQTEPIPIDAGELAAFGVDIESLSVTCDCNCDGSESGSGPTVDEIANGVADKLSQRLES